MSSTGSPISYCLWPGTGSRPSASMMGGWGALHGLPSMQGHDPRGAGTCRL